MPSSEKAIATARLRNAARWRALIQLRKQHPALYLTLYDAEVQKLEQQGE